MAKVRVLVIRTAGINCDEEVMHCWRLAQAVPTLVHLDALMNEPAILDDYQIVTIPGGFSYGDDIAAGTIFAQRLTIGLAEPLRKLVDRGGGLLGICNGFQILVKAGLLPGRAVNGECNLRVTVTYNDSAKFEARWVKLQVATDRCVFLTPGSVLDMPVEHAEGKVVVSGGDVVAELEASGQIAVRYVNGGGTAVDYPANPNGSVSNIAGLCDATGRILGLMPHPDRNFDLTHHPQWTSRAPEGVPDGLTVFQNAVNHWGS